MIRNQAALRLLTVGLLAQIALFSSAVVPHALAQVAVRTESSAQPPLAGPAGPAWPTEPQPVAPSAFAPAPGFAAPASHHSPPELEEPVADIEVYVAPQKPAGRSGPFQQIAFSAAALPRGNDPQDFGVVDFELNAIFALPAPTRESPLIFKPGFEVHLLEGPAAPDLPAQLFDEYLQVRWLSMLTENFGVDLSLTPGWHSDHQNQSGDAFRTTAHAIGGYDLSPETKVVLGVAYLDSEDVGFTPVAGVIWKPSPDLTLELIVPKPRVAWRHSCKDGCETWFFIAGEYGSGEWAIERAAGFEDTITAHDYRFLWGIERKQEEGLDARFEMGYVFGREVEYLSGTPSITPPDTILVRTGISY